MGGWHRVRSARSVAVAGVAVGALAGAFVTSALGSGRIVNGEAATVHSNSPARSISATEYVSAIYCGAVGRRRYAGQRSGVQLLSRYTRSGGSAPTFDFAGYYSYCKGRKPVYTAEFLISNNSTGILHFKPAHLRISPGDPLAVSVKRVHFRIRLKITDLNTKKSRTVSGPWLRPNSGWAAGALELFARPTGQPYLTGWVRLLNLYSPTDGPAAVAGPVPWAPMVFTHLRVNGHIVGHKTKHVQLTMWRVGAGASSAGSKATTAGALATPGGSEATTAGALATPGGSEATTAGITATTAGTTPTNATVTPPSNGSFESHDGGLPPPTLGKNVDITPVSGDVLVKQPGQKHFKHVPRGTSVPNGSQIDARNGSVQMTLALPHGGYETGVFYDGRFQLDQNRGSGATTATLTDGNSARSCPATTIEPGDTVVGVASVARTTASAAKAKGKKGKGKGKKLGSLWANAHGSFTTKGSGGAAAVLGTKWFTENTCAGTYFKVVRDKIKVTAYYPHVHTVVVTAGHSYLAPNKVAPVKVAPIIKVSPVTTTDGRFNVHVTDTYRLTVISQGHPSYVDAAVAPNLPGNGTTPLFADGSVDGVPRWYVLFNITPNLINFQYWNVGVRIGSKMYLVRLRVHG